MTAQKMHARVKKLIESQMLSKAFATIVQYNQELGHNVLTRDKELEITHSLWSTGYRLVLPAP